MTDPKARFNRHFRDILVTVGILILSVAASFLFEKVFLVWEHITTVFVFAVFLVSLLTDGYLYGMAATAVGVLCINYVFTSPYFHFDFSAPESIFSAAVMLVISIMTSALTVKLKKWQALRAEGEREKMRANLLRAVSHDIRTPLTTIYGSSSGIIENYDGLSDGQKKEMLLAIKEDSEWLVRIVENLLSVTRVDNGRAKIFKTPTVLDELIDSAVLKFKKRYPDYNLTVELPATIILIPMDAILIEQVLINIFENAVRHAKGMTELKLCVYEKNEYATFEISDDGCGIDEERIDKIFSGNYAAQRESVDSEKRNAGIGLSVCASIIKAHGGKIYAENLKDGGALFGFILKTDSLAGDENGAE